jgi:hypothetical protein
MWILHFIPDSWLYQAVIAIIAGGLVGFLGGFIIALVPGFKLSGTVIKYTSLAVFCAGVYFFGSYSTEMTWRARAEAMQKKLDEASAKSKQKTALLQKKLNTQTLIIKQKAKDNANAIKKYADKIDANCKLTDTVIQLHNAAASNSEVSGTSKGTNGELPKSTTSSTDDKVK